MNPLSGQAAVVTGAGRGIGRAIALRLAEAGANIVLVARSPDQLEAVASEIRAMGREALTVPADIAGETHAVRIVEATLNRFGQADILVNNAAAFAGGPVVSMRVEDWDTVLNTNLRGTFLVTRAFLPAMIQRQRGTIIMIASTSGKRGDAGASAYAASKFGMIGFSQSLSAEVRPHNIRVNGDLSQRSGHAPRRQRIQTGRRQRQPSVRRRRGGDRAPYGSAAAAHAGARGGTVGNQPVGVFVGRPGRATLSEQLKKKLDL